MNVKWLRACPGFLVLLCIVCSSLIASSFISLPLPGMDGKAYAAAGPDLYIESITWSPAQPVLDNQTYFTVTVSNLGDGVALDSRLLFIIDNEIIQSEPIASITAHGTVRYIYRWKALNGTHMTKAIIDSNNTVLESNEANNEKAYTFSVLAPDLIVESITSSPQNVSQGDIVTFTVTTKNTGNTAAAQSAVEFFIDGATRGLKAGTTLAPGAAYTSEFRWSAETGQHIISATADAMADVVEGNEDNNSLTQIFCTTPPDLVISSITWSPVNRAESGNVTMSITVKNQGEGDALNSWLYYYIDETLQQTVFINPLAAGESVIKTYNWGPGTDERLFSATIDGNGIIAESDDYNNSFSVMLPALGLSDLTIQSLSWSPQSPKTNSKVAFTVVVKNTGLRTVNEYVLSLHISNKYLFKNTLGPIPPNGTETRTYECFLSIPTVSVYAIVDPENLVEEINELNNDITSGFTPVQPTPVEDLSIESITFSPADPSPGDEVLITTVLRNNGKNSANASSAVCYIDNALLGDIYFGQIAAGASLERTIKWTAVMGAHEVKIVIDPNDYLFEISETNNEKTVSVTTTAPDLAIESIDWFPANPEIGAAIQFSVTIKNQGQKTSTPCYATYYIEGNNHGEHYIGALEPGASLTKSFPWNMQAAALTFKVVIDEADAVLETDETNNEKTAIIPAPNIVLRGITCSEDYPEANAILSFTADVINGGRSQSSASTITAYIDGTILEQTDLSALSPGQSAQTVFYWTAVPGKHTLRIVADTGNGITESNEADNYKEVIIFVPLPSASDPVEATGEPSDNSTLGQELTETPAMPSPTDIILEDLLKEIDEETAPDISGNISATPNATSGGIKDILTNKFLIFGVAGAGIAAVAVLLILRKRGSQPKKEKTPKEPKAPKAPKAEKPKKEVKKKVQKPVASPAKTTATLSGQPPVLVHTPPKPSTQAAAGSLSAPIKVIVPPVPVAPPANPNPGPTLIKQPPPVQPPPVK